MPFTPKTNGRKKKTKTNPTLTNETVATKLVIPPMPKTGHNFALTDMIESLSSAQPQSSNMDEFDMASLCFNTAGISTNNDDDSSSSSESAMDTMDELFANTEEEWDTDEEIRRKEELMQWHRANHSDPEDEVPNEQEPVVRS